MPDRVDYDYELGNGWNRWQNLVLSALKENKEAVDKLIASNQEIKLAHAVAAEREEQTRANVSKLAESQEEQGEEIKDLQTSRDRGMGALALIGALLIPALIPILTTVIVSIGGS